MAKTTKKKAAPKKARAKKAAKPHAKKVGAKKVGAKKLATKKTARKKSARKLPKRKRAAALLTAGPTAEVLDRLWAVVMSRREADPAFSHSARLLSRGSTKVAQKFGEEAVECLIEAVAGNRDAVVAESADVLYHLIVLWVDAGLRPDEIWTELHMREGISGIAEKASRGADPVPSLAPKTTKIP